MVKLLEFAKLYMAATINKTYAVTNFIKMPPIFTRRAKYFEFLHITFFLLQKEMQLVQCILLMSHNKCLPVLFSHARYCYRTLHTGSHEPLNLHRYDTTVKLLMQLCAILELCSEILI